MDFPPFHGEKGSIYFLSEDVAFKLKDEKKTGDWLKKVIEREEKQLHSLNFIFCSDEFLHLLNIEFLDHDTLTDVITFPYAPPPAIQGDIFISIDRVKENAATYKISFVEELRRVMVHGVLHLCGFGDKTPDEIQAMRQKENEALAIFNEDGNNPISVLS